MLTNARLKSLRDKIEEGVKEVEKATKPEKVEVKTEKKKKK